MWCGYGYGSLRGRTHWAETFGISSGCPNILIRHIHIMRSQHWRLQATILWKTEKHFFVPHQSICKYWELELNYIQTYRKILGQSTSSRSEPGSCGWVRIATGGLSNITLCKNEIQLVSARSKLFWQPILSASLSLALPFRLLFTSYSNIHHANLTNLHHFLVFGRRALALCDPHAPYIEA